MRTTRRNDEEKPDVAELIVMSVLRGTFVSYDCWQYWFLTLTQICVLRLTYVQNRLGGGRAGERERDRQ